MAAILKIAGLCALFTGPTQAVLNFGDMSPEAIADENMMEKGFFSAENIQFMFKEVGDVMGMLLQTDAHKEQAHQDHLERGALRSGSGSAHQKYERERLFAEHELLDQLEDSREVVTDPKLVDKLFMRYQKKMLSATGVDQDADIRQVELKVGFAEPSQSFGRQLAQK